MAAAGSRSELTIRTRGGRVYSNRGQRLDSGPLQTLLYLVSLNVEPAAPGDGAPANIQDLKEVISALYQVATREFHKSEILALATRRACSMAGASGAALAMRQGETYVCCSRHGQNAPSLGAHFSSDSGISGECVRTAQILCCQDTEIDNRVNANVCRELGIRSIVAVPVFDRGCVCGVLEVFADRPAAFQDRDIHLLQLISALVAHSLQDEHCAAPEHQDLASPETADSTVSNSEVLKVEPATRLQQPASVAQAVETESLPVPVESWIRKTKRNSFANAGLRIAVGFAAAALLFVGVWASMARTGSPKPLRDTVSAQLAPAPAPTTPSAVEQSPAAPVQISGIEFKSHGQFTAVRVKLARPVRHTSARLQNPERIYFDLFDSNLGASFGAKKGTTIQVNDSFIAKIRAVQTSEHSTRIVLDLNCACDYTAVSPDAAPYELSILVQPPHAKNQPVRSSPKPANDTKPTVKPVVSEQATGAAPGKLTIVIDPGHGGSDLGTIGPGGLTEKDLVLDIATRLGAMLSTKLGATVVFTRTGDRSISLEGRDQIANNAHADLLISIHANSSPDRLTRGVETYYSTSSNSPASYGNGGPTLQPVSLDVQRLQTKRLAALVQRGLHTVLSRKDQGLRDRGVKRAQFVLLMNASMPAILTEVAFISSPSDERNLSRLEARETIAKGLFQGISDYVKKQSLAAGL